MSTIPATEAQAKRDQNSKIEIVPRFSDQQYSEASVAQRRNWVEKKTDTTLDLVSHSSLNPGSLRGNIENPIGSVQIPLGVAGPLRVHGEHAEGDFLVPLATTEGALVKSYERGAVAITRAGGAQTRITNDSNCCSPIFTLTDVVKAADFCRHIEKCFDQFDKITSSTTNHGKLLSAVARQIGRDVVLDLKFFAADAHGMNLCSKATEAICQWLRSERPEIETHLTLSGASSEKRVSGAAFRVGKGKHVVAGVTIPRKIVRRHLFSTPEGMCHMLHRTLLGQIQSGTIGYNGHVANGLTALFIACGQDVANVVNGSVAMTSLEVDSGGDLVASVTLPSLNVATIGGGTGIGTGKECLQLLGCLGKNKCRKFAEIVAATILAGELSFGASLAHGDFSNAHEKYGRNRPAGNTL